MTRLVRQGVRKNWRTAGVRSSEFGVRSLEFGVWSLEFGVWSAERDIAKFGARASIRDRALAPAV